jgi:hypothetical protein
LVKEGVWALHAKQLFSSGANPLRPVLPCGWPKETPDDIVFPGVFHPVQSLRAVVGWWRQAMKTRRGQLLAEGLGIVDTVQVVALGASVLPSPPTMLSSLTGPGADVVSDADDKDSFMAAALASFVHFADLPVNLHSDDHQQLEEDRAPFVSPTGARKRRGDASFAGAAMVGDGALNDEEDDELDLKFLGGWVRPNAVARDTRWVVGDTRMELVRKLKIFVAPVGFVFMSLAFAAALVLEIWTLVEVAPSLTPTVVVLRALGSFIWVAGLGMHVAVATFTSRHLIPLSASIFAIAFPSTLPPIAGGGEDALPHKAALARLAVRRDQLIRRETALETLTGVIDHGALAAFLLYLLMAVPMVRAVKQNRGRYDWLRGHHSLLYRAQIVQLIDNPDASVLQYISYILALAVVIPNMVVSVVLMSVMPKVLDIARKSLLEAILRLEEPQAAHTTASMLVAEFSFPEVDEDEVLAVETEPTPFDDSRDAAGTAAGKAAQGHKERRKEMVISSMRVGDVDEEDLPALRLYFRTILRDYKSLRSLWARAGVLLEPALTIGALGFLVSGGSFIILGLFNSQLWLWVYGISFVLASAGVLAIPAMSSQAVAELLPRVVSSSTGPLSRLVEEYAALLSSLDATASSLEPFRVLGVPLRPAVLLRVFSVLVSASLALIPFILTGSH